jgi:5'-AMP-activated protein kinase catalytic alpha subunit
VEVSDIERVSREIHILKMMRHPNIIQLYEIIESQKYLFLVMEYCPNGELFDYIVKKERYRCCDVDLTRQRHANSISSLSVG